MDAIYFCHIQKLLSFCINFCSKIYFSVGIMSNIYFFKHFLFGSFENMSISVQTFHPIFYSWMGFKVTQFYLYESAYLFLMERLIQTMKLITLSFSYKFQEIKKFSLVQNKIPFKSTFFLTNSLYSPHQYPCNILYSLSPLILLYSIIYTQFSLPGFKIVFVNFLNMRN